MRHSGCEIYLHFVWATKHRQPMVCIEWEAELYRVIRAEALRAGCSVLAINGTEDHLHILLKMGSTVSAARLVNQMKGVSSNFINERYCMNGEQTRFCWQNGYGVCSVGINQLTPVFAYIHQQKEHHAGGTSRERWEPQSTCP